jgi:predicted  nucleic acid-binding Zn-ribbon protein
MSDSTERERQDDGAPRWISETCHGCGATQHRTSHVTRPACLNCGRPFVSTSPTEREQQLRDAWEAGWAAAWAIRTAGAVTPPAPTAVSYTSDAATPSPDTRLREALDSIAAEWEDDANGWILDPIMAGSAETLRRCAAQIRRALSSHTTEP